MSPLPETTALSESRAWTSTSPEPLTVALTEPAASSKPRRSPLPETTTERESTAPRAEISPLPEIVSDSCGPAAPSIFTLPEPATETASSAGVVAMTRMPLLVAKEPSTSMCRVPSLTSVLMFGSRFSSASTSIECAGPTVRSTSMEPPEATRVNAAA